MRITIAGTGYVGLGTGAVLAEHRHEVTCVDVDRNKINILSNGGCTIFEPGLPELLQKNKDRMSFTTNGGEAYSSAELVIIAVGTPERADGLAPFLYAVIGPRRYAITNDNLRDAGVLVTPEVRMVQTNFFSFQPEWVDLMGELVEDEDRNNLAVKIIVSLIDAGRCVIALS